MNDFLPFREFADKWIEENVDDSFYGGMKGFVREFVALVIRQNHSGGSVGMFMNYVFNLMEDYHNQGK